MTLVLASGSPRRRMLLEGGGAAPLVRPPAVDETPRPDESAVRLVRRLAAAKATAVDGPIVLAADTIVALDGRVLGKPSGTAQARAMLRAQAGRVVTVWSGVAVAHAGTLRTRVVGTLLRFRRLDRRDVQDYLDTGEPTGVAGAFRIQGQGGALIDARAGCWTNVVGLPTCQASRLLGLVGVDLDPDGCR